MNLSQYLRRKSHVVRIGEVEIGGNHPIAVQSMTNTDTNNTEASVAQIERIDRAGGKIVRLTAQGRKEGENLKNIVARLRADGFDTATVADIHFLPEVAAVAANYVDKVRINPGNYRLDRGELEALIAQCRERGVALRIGVIGCPAISMVGGKAKIDTTLCVGCGVCQQLCKPGALNQEV
ncbi:MAG: flavodoxin-dependent (E)-4-hydroxy-3-methylbut-2-enyl-diphosphate synthase [Alistipes sp.]|nr:flavodoxin-dependent (E)-4-hydroxy-3-methylbut-2-enyl-diphosphate synthase [Alistipes sp.]